MPRYRVRSGPPLEGTVRVSGMTKNAGLKQMAAALLTSGVTRLSNVTPVADLEVMIKLLGAIGAEATWELEQPSVRGPGIPGRSERDQKLEQSSVLRIDVASELRPECPYELVSRMRASINVLGPLLARVGHARVAMPGGDNIGSRKLDMHFGALQAMGTELEIVHGYIEARCHRLCGARVVFEFPSVGATETVLTAAVLAKGETVLENAAREPEIVDLARLLIDMGARIDGVGTSTLTIEGVDELYPADHAIIGDRIEAGTLVMACAAAGGAITVEGIELEHLGTVVDKLVDMGLEITRLPDGLSIRSGGELRAVDLQTLPFPGFATDFMPLAVAALTVASGTSIVTENVFDNRFAFVDELRRMGADVRTDGRHAIVRGVAQLSGAPVRAFDVRAGAALVLAGLAATGETVVNAAHHVERGYTDLPGKLAELGADVVRLGDDLGPDTGLDDEEDLP